MARRNTALISILSILATTEYLPADDSETIQLNFKVFGIGKDSYDGLYYINKSRYTPVNFHKTSRSVSSYKYEGLSPITFFVKNPDFLSDDPDSTPYLPVASCNVSEPIQQCLIIFVANPENRNVSDAERTFKLFGLDDSTSFFGHNSMVILNATGAQLFGKVNHNKMILPVGLSQPIQYSTKSNTQSATTIAFALETKDGIRLVMSNDVKLPSDRRIVLILEPPKQVGSMRISARMLSESIYISSPLEE